MMKEGKKSFEITDKNQKPLGEGCVLEFTHLEIKKRFSFLEYVFGGCQISLSVAIDFTLSNGHPSKPNSLHYLDMNRNEYLNAIKSVGQILQYYDSNK